MTVYSSAPTEANEDLEKQDWEAFIMLWLHMDIRKLEKTLEDARSTKINKVEVEKLDDFLKRSLNAYTKGNEDESSALCEAAWERANMLNLYLSNRVKIKTGTKIGEASEKGAKFASSAAADRRNKYQVEADKIWKMNPKLSKSQVAERIADKFVPDYLERKDMSKDEAPLAKIRLQGVIRREILKAS